jgi:hypothetical protein
MRLSELCDFSFWLFYLGYNFPNASSERDQSMIDEFIFSEYPYPSQEWYENLVGNACGNPDIPCNGVNLEFPINKDVCFIVEFHHEATRFYLNDTYMGETGGHYHLSCLKWKELLSLVESQANSLYIFFLMLPLVVALPNESKEARVEIEKYLRNLPFKNEDIPVIADYLLSHMVKKENAFEEKENTGTICTYNHSMRNPKCNDEVDILELNRLIIQAVNR